MLEDEKIDDKLDHAARRRWRRAFLAWGSVSMVVALAAGWTVLWFAASYAAQSRIDDWFAQEAQRGRAWSCPTRRVEGFPTRLYVVCDAPSFSGPVEGVDVRGRLTRLAAGAFLLTPGRVDVDLGSPLTIETRDGSARLALAFARLRLDLRFSLDDLQRSTLLGEDMEIHWNGPYGAVDGAVQAVELTMQAVDGAEHTYDVAVQSAGVVFPELDKLTASADPAKLQAKARLTGAEPGEGEWAEHMERWRAAQGRLLIERLAFDKGALEVTASGELGLDELHRLQGRIELGGKGADSILLRLGVPPAAIGVANALGGLLRGPTDKAVGRPAVKLPLALENGKVAIGPLRNVFSLKPLY